MAFYPSAVTHEIHASFTGPVHSIFREIPPVFLQRPLSLATSTHSRESAPLEFDSVPSTDDRLSDSFPYPRPPRIRPIGRFVANESYMVRPSQPGSIYHSRWKTPPDLLGPPSHHYRHDPVPTAGYCCSPDIGLFRFIGGGVCSQTSGSREIYPRDISARFRRMFRIG